MTETILNVRNLCVSHGKVEAVHSVGFRVGRGQIVTIIGPNGAGKSTLLNALIGLLPHSAGEIEFMGKLRARVEVEEMVAAGLILVPEKRELFAEMSVEDNLQLGAFMRRRLGHRDERDGIETVYRTFPRLKERAAQKAGTLSGGERQMLAVGRALMARPKLLMLDEPSLGLAPLVVREIFRVIVELRDSGVSILLVEQNAKAALRVADYGYVLEMGEVALAGDGATLAANPRVAEAYLGGGGHRDIGFT